MLNLKTTPKKAIELLTKQIEDAKKIPNKNGYYDFYQSIRWVQTTIFIIGKIYGGDDKHVNYFSCVLDAANKQNPQIEMTEAVNLGWTTLVSFIDELDIILENPELQEPYILKINPAIQDSLKKFKLDYISPKKTAFIMMRFGETTQHEKIFEAIRTILMKNDICGLRADIFPYHEDLYYNILTYMHGCDLGIAVFEVIEDREYNPNVAFEVGYLKALGKSVCLLKEKTLERLHTDLIGKSYNEFDMNNCESTIEVQLNDWLLSNGFTRPT